MVSNETRNNIIAVGLMTALGILVFALIQNAFSATEQVGEAVENAATTQTDLLINISSMIDSYINQAETDRDDFVNQSVETVSAIHNETKITNELIMNQTNQIDQLIRYLNTVMAPNMTFTGLGEGN